MPPRTIRGYKCSRMTAVRLIDVDVEVEQRNPQVGVLLGEQRNSLAYVAFINSTYWLHLLLSSTPCNCSTAMLSVPAAFTNFSL